MDENQTWIEKSNVDGNSRVDEQVKVNEKT